MNRNRRHIQISEIFIAKYFSYSKGADFIAREIGDKPKRRKARKESSMVNEQL